MLSSLTSFLPPTLHLSSNTNNIAPPVVDDDDDDDENEELKPEEGESSAEKKKAKKAKGANETFIFVRPPPAKSNHPLNLQVQLVPPNTRAPGVTATSRQSLDGEPPASPTPSTGADSETSGTTLARTVSTQSSRSEISTFSSSGYASTASFSSVASTSTSGGRRMIIPLYNLQAHNVMTNTIVDAGTDAKIARFTKRGLEMIDLAVLEVVEVWVTPTGPLPQGDGNTWSARGSIDEGSRVRRVASFLQPQQPHTGSRPVTPDPEHITPGSSAVSVSSAGLSTADVQHHYQTPVEPPAPSQKRNIFGKLFEKRKVVNSPDTTPTMPSYPSSPTTTKTPTQKSTMVPPSPTSSSRHARNLSASIATFKRSPSASPSRPLTSSGQAGGTTLGLRGLIKSARPTSALLETGDMPKDPVAIDFGAVAPTSSRLSASSRTGTNLDPSTASGANGPSNTGAPQAGVPQGLVLPATLGIQPILSSPGGPAALQAFANFNSAGYPPPKNLGFGRGPAMYVWVVRKWIKTPEGAGGAGMFALANGMRDMLGGIGARAGNGGQLSSNDMSAGLAQVEVRLEWKRAKKPKSKKKGKENADASTSRRGSRSGSQIRPGGEVGPSESNSSLPSAAGTYEDGGVERKRRHRLSTLSTVSTSISEDIHETGSTSGQGSRFSKRGRSKGRSVPVDDDGEDSDPEDSETPWTCTVKVKRLGAPRGGPTSPLKFKVGVLSPTPHHPKVVAMLKVPFPLPDLEVQNMVTRARATGIGGGPPGSPGTAPNSPSGVNAGMVLTAEEIKDVVCSTGMWVVVREGFGGVGKVSRKGDGWRIRA